MIRIFSKLVLCLMFTTGSIRCTQISSARSFEIPSSAAAKGWSLLRIRWLVDAAQSSGGNWSCSIPARGFELTLSGRGTEFLKLGIQRADVSRSKLAVPFYVATSFHRDSGFQIGANDGVLDILLAAPPSCTGRAILAVGSRQLHGSLEWDWNCQAVVGQ